MSAVIISKVSKRFSNCTIYQKGLMSYTNIVTSILCKTLDVSISNYSDVKQNIGNKPILRLVTKDNCSLCEEAKRVLSVSGRFDEQFVLQEVDILQEGNEELFDLYRYEIPVFFLGKKFISKNRIDLDKLQQELEKLKKSEE